MVSTSDGRGTFPAQIGGVDRRKNHGVPSHDRHHDDVPMPSITNVGGSLTTAVALTLLAWSVRALRAAALRNAATKARAPAARRLRHRLHATMTLAALHVLCQLDAVPYLVVDTREELEDAEPLDEGDRNASNEGMDPTKRNHPSTHLDEQAHVLYLPEEQLEETFSSTHEEWESKVGRKKPEQEHVLAFVADDTWRAQACAAQVASMGYLRCVAVRAGGNPVEPVRFVHRDAVAEAIRSNRKGLVVLDLRRHDERVLYGAPLGSKHLPAEQVPRALSMSEDEFQDTFGFDKPAKQDNVVLMCRSDRRARWASQLLVDAGYPRVFVCKEGVYGWRLDHRVLPYQSYELGDPPPDPEPFEIEPIDLQAARKELQSMGLATS